MRTVVEVVLWVLLVWFVLALAVTITLMIIDRGRKSRQKSRPITFPRLDPVRTELGDSTLTVYTYGEDLFGDMLEAIRSAESTIFLESYIWKSDEMGTRFKEAVIAAADRGVDVYVIFDGFANIVVPRSFKRFPEPVNVLKYPAFNPKVLLARVRDTGRDHRKLLVVDDRVGFIGGYNIGSDYATKWRDTHLRVEGPQVWDLRNAFVDFWNSHRRGRPALSDPGARHWEPRFRVSRNLPNQLSYPIRTMYLDAIDRASSRVWITQAYFIPDRDILAALLRAAGRGVDVRVLVPEVSNHVLCDWLSRGFYGQLLRGGVKIVLLQGAMVHAKTATIDGRWSTIGTANIDRLSLTGNYEVNADVVDDDLAKVMDRIFENDSTQTRILTAEEWASRHTMAVLCETILIPLRPFL